MPRKNWSELSQEKAAWVCAVGKHQQIWDYSITGSYESCLSFAWGVLQHEIDVPWYKFQQELKRSNGYIGKFAEVQKLVSQPIWSEGMLIGDRILIFDAPAQVKVGLSKPVYAGLVPGTRDFIFAERLYRGAEEMVYQNRLGNYQKLKGARDKQSTLIEPRMLKYSDYPLIITDSPFILAKVYTEGLIGGFVPSMLSIASVEIESNQGFGSATRKIKREIYEWVKSCPKKVLIVQEKQKKFCQQGYYVELEDYFIAESKAIEELNSSLKQIGSSISRIEVETNIASSCLVERVSQILLGKN